MGRPLNKKYFGNRNIGTQGNQTTQHGTAYSTDGDDHIGGEGIAGAAFGASVADTSYGSGAYLDRMPSITAIGAPTIANGVQAAAAVTHVQAVHGNPNVSGTANGDDYLSGDILTVTTGTASTPAKFTVGALQVSGYTIVTGNDGNTAHGYAVGDAMHFDNGVVLTVATISGNGSGGYPANRGPVTSATLTNAGSYTGTTPPTGTVGQSNPTELGGRGFTVNFSWGVKTVTVLQAGDYTAVAGTASATTVTHANLSASLATGCTLDIFYGIKTITVSQKGSGYTGAETITFSATTDGSETRATGTIVLTTDTGAVGSATNQENAIIAYAWVDGLEEVDIIRQVSTDRYRINSNATGNKDVGYIVGKLKETGVASGSFTGNEGREMNIWAFDANGDSYLVKKLTARKAVVYPFACARLSKSAGTQFAAGSAIPWKFFEGQANASAGYVKIENA